MKRYTYTYGPIWRTAALSALIPFTIRILIDFSYEGLLDALQSALVFILVLPPYVHYWELTTWMELGMHELILHRRIGRDRKLAYVDINRATVRQTEGQLGRDALELKLAMHDDIVTIPITYLEDRDAFVRSLRHRVEEGNSRLLFQDAQGEFLPSLTALVRKNLA
jgi:hypothetical protein